jgi:hypothetical protein
MIMYNIYTVHIRERTLSVYIYTLYYISLGIAGSLWVWSGVFRHVFDVSATAASEPIDDGDVWRDS